MKISGKTMFRNWFHLPASWRRNRRKPEYASDELPLRAELFSADQMERHGKTLAGSHRLGLRRAPDQLLARLAENEGVLLEACNLLTVGGQSRAPDFAGR